MTRLRQKMIRAMELNNFSHHTQRAYLAAVTGIAKFYNQSPEKMTPQKIEDYLLYLKHQKGNAPNSCYSVLTGLRFFYKHVTEKPIPVTYSIRRTRRKLPQVLTMQQIWKIICSTNNLKHRLILMTTYSAGLRVSETINLRPENIDSQTMTIKVKGKGKKERYTLIRCFQKHCSANSGPIIAGIIPKRCCSPPVLRKIKISLYPTNPFAKSTKMPEKKRM
jgi:site-specific recombinase XerD